MKLVGRWSWLVLFGAATFACDKGADDSTADGDVVADVVDEAEADEASPDADAEPDVEDEAEAEAVAEADAEDVAEAEDGGSDCVETGETFDLTGIFAVEAIVNLQALLAVESRQYFVMNVAQDGTTVTQTSRVCDISLPTIPGMVEIAVPAALQTLIRSVTQEDSGAYLDGTTACAAYEPPEQVVVLGADLAVPMTDPLPTMTDLTHAVDQDSDTHPGVSTDVTMEMLCGADPVQLYVALRTIVGLEGVVADSNTVSGPVTPDFDLSVLGYADACLSPAADLVIEVQSGSRFRMLRVDGLNGAPDLDTDDDGEVGCDELAAGLDTVFGG